MSKKINVNPGPSKVAGREYQGEDVVYDFQRQVYAQQLVRAERWQPKRQEAPSVRCRRRRERTSGRPNPGAEWRRRPRGRPLQPRWQREQENEGCARSEDSHEETQGAGAKNTRDGKQKEILRKRSALAAAALGSL